jgi:hypothetical protein
MMRGLLILLTGSIAMLAASLLVRLFLLPDIVPVAWAEELQPLWAVEAAFLLHATEFVAIGTTLIAVVGIIQLSARRRGTTAV